ncbi:MAG: hypothetical protein R2910_01235 [Gemmatimonadales bacterium]
MLSPILLLAATALSPLPIQDAQEILATVASKQAERMAGVHNYVIIQKVQGGMEAPFYYEEFAPEGTMAKFFRVVPMSEWKQRDPRNQAAGMDPQGMAAGMSQAIGIMAGPLSAKLIGTPVGQMMPAGAMDEMVGGATAFLDAAATYQEGDGRAEATAAYFDAAQFAQRASLQGTHTVFGGRRAYLLVADGLSDLPPQQVGEATFVVNKVSVWIDTVEFVQLQLRVAGTMEKDGQSVPMKIELNQWDYAKVGPLYEPRRRMMGISGLMAGSQLDPKQQQKMAKAQADMEKLKRQIAAMPASQRAMIQGQVDKAERQLALMTNNDVMTSEIELMVFSINKGPPFDWMPFCPSLIPGAPPFPTPVAGANQPPAEACGS